MIRVYYSNTKTFSLYIIISNYNIIKNKKNNSKTSETNSTCTMISLRVYYTALRDSSTIHQTRTTTLLIRKYSL